MDKLHFKIIDGALYRRSVEPYAYDFRIHDLGHGQVEALAQPRHAWHEVGLCSQRALEDAEKSSRCIYVDGEWVKHQPSEHELAEREAQNRERSARRARTKVRRLVKAKNLDTMLTMTYRENMQDRDRMARDVDVFVKRIRRILPTFEYVCVFERQKRGAYHAHIAVQRVQSHYLFKGVLVKSYDLLRAIWRAVVIDGNVDVSRTRNRRKGNAGKLAGYLSKYISKGFIEGEAGDSYRASGRALPEPTLLRSSATDPLSAASDLAGVLLSFWPGSAMHGVHLDGGGYYLSLSP